jgi:hypothetical protein
MASNRHNGEVSITGESGTVYVLKNSFKGMVAVEDMFDKTFDEITVLSDKGSKRHLRAIIWSLFLHKQPELNIDTLDDVIDDCGGLTAMMATVMKTVAASMPDTKDLEAMGVKPLNPPQAAREKRPTGAASISRPGAQA